MEIRDKIKDEAYFQTYLAEEENRLVKFQGKLDNNEIKEERILPVKEAMLGIKYQILAGKYSAGYDLNELRNEFIAILKDVPLFYNGTSYDEIALPLIYGVLYHISDEDFNVLADLVFKYRVEDYYIDSLIHYRKPEWVIHDKIIFPKNYRKLCEIMQMEKAEAETAMKHYLDTWYQSNKGEFWYDVHKKQGNLYNGYWNWEAGAIVKIIGLDDSSFKDNQYYPYDLVHYSEK